MEQRKKKGRDLGLIKAAYHIALYHISRLKPSSPTFIHCKWNRFGIYSELHIIETKSQPTRAWDPDLGRNDKAEFSKH